MKIGVNLREKDSKDIQAIFFYFKAEMIKSGCLMLKQQSSNEAQVQ